MTEKTDKKKCVQSTDCKSGKHTFIVTQWFIHGGKQKATFMRCQHCLMPMSLEEIESKEWREKEGLS